MLRPSTASGPISRRAVAASMSSCPMWMPAQRTARKMSIRSLISTGTEYLSHSSFVRFAISRNSPVSTLFSRTCTTVTPPFSACVSTLQASGSAHLLQRLIVVLSCQLVPALRLTLPGGRRSRPVTKYTE